MGTAITKVLKGRKIDQTFLRNKTLAVDAFNTLYTFLTTIRGYDGKPLTTKSGIVTSHLVGIFNRFTTYLAYDMRFVFVFDGEPPKAKEEELKRRKKKKRDAKKQYKEAKKAGDVENMKKYAARTVFLTEDMQKQAKKLITLMGMDYIDAPSEGEVQAAQIAKNGDAYAVLSQDADSLLAGAPRVVRNLSISGKRKLPGKKAYTSVDPEMYELQKELKDLGITQKQLIALAILLGTDYNYGGVKGIGPKRGMNLLRKHGEDLDAVFEAAKWVEHYDVPWQNIYETITSVPVTDDYEFSFGDMKRDELRNVLVNEYEFSADRVESTFSAMDAEREKLNQTGLDQFF